jgi:hypothetical protein
MLKKSNASVTNRMDGWIQIVKKGAPNTKKPIVQLLAANTAIKELSNLIIYGTAESSKTVENERKTEYTNSVSVSLQEPAPATRI